MANPTPTPTPDRPPLWRVMLAAFSNRWLDVEPTSTDNAAGLAYAAEIRAVRDYLLPEEPPPHRGMRPGGTNLTYQETLSVERQRLRAQLTAEADRAERGDG